MAILLFPIIPAAMVAADVASFEFLAGVGVLLVFAWLLGFDKD